MPSAASNAPDGDKDMRGPDLPRGYEVPWFSGGIEELPTVLNLVDLIYDERIVPRRYVTTLFAFRLKGPARAWYNSRITELRELDWPALRAEAQEEFANVLRVQAQVSKLKNARFPGTDCRPEDYHAHIDFWRKTVASIPKLEDWMTEKEAIQLFMTQLPNGIGGQLSATWVKTLSGAYDYAAACGYVLTPGRPRCKATKIRGTVSPFS